MFKGDIRFRIFYFDFFSNIEQIGTIYISNGSIYSQYME